MTKRSARERVRALHDVICRQTLDLDRSSSGTREADEDAKMFLQMWEADITGIAQRLIEGVSLEHSHYEMLRQPIVIGSKIQFGPCFYDPNGPFDASHWSELLNYAENVEELRKACVTLLSH
jgi:hypothetical protein